MLIHATVKPLHPQLKKILKPTSEYPSLSEHECNLHLHDLDFCVVLSSNLIEQRHRPRQCIVLDLTITNTQILSENGLLQQTITAIMG